MNKFSTVFTFEAKCLLRKKSFIITTIILMLIFFSVSFIPRIITLFTKDSTQEESIHEGVVLLTDDFSAEDFIGMDYVIYLDESSMRADIKADVISSGFVVKGIHAYDMVFKDRQIGNIRFQDDFEVIRENRILEMMGIDINSYRAALSMPVDMHYDILGSDGFSNYPMTYLFIFIFYFLVIFYGNVISSSVAREKGDRTMELLITSTDSNSLLFGKVLGAGLVGVLQFVFLILAALLGYYINKDSFGFDISQFVQIGTKELICFILFTLVGYFLYLFLYAALGSAVSKMEDVASSTTPITLLLVGTYILAVFTMNVPDLHIFKIASFFPFSSPMIMPARVNLTSVPDVQVFLSLGILIATGVLLGFFAARVYRMGTLNYGNRLTFKRMISGLFNRN